MNAAMAPTREATSRHHGHDSTEPVKLGDAVAGLLLAACTPEQLRHIAAAAEARGHLPDWLAIQLANELATIFSKPPMEIDGRLVTNRPTVGWWSRRAKRVAEAARAHG